MPRALIGPAAASSTIESITTTPVNLPLVAPYRWVAGVNEGFTKVVVEVTTNDGIVGLGEAANWRHARLIDEELAPRLVGLKVADLRECWRSAVPPVQTMHNIESDDLIRAYGGIEMALWDAVGKRCELPLYRLLGGSTRKKVAFTEYFSARERRGSQGGESSPSDIAAYCAQMVEDHGSPHFEGKVGYTDLETDICIAREVRDAIGPHRSLRLDANMGWKLPTAREALRSMEALRIANVEDPVGGLEAMAELRRHTTIPFSTHSANLRSAVRLGVPDSVALNLTVLGGIEKTMRFVGACEAMGMGFSFYSGETGIGTAAYLHVAATDPCLSIPSQSLLRWYTTDVITGGPFQPQEGYLDVPERPGLGVELDRQALANAHAEFVKRGPLQEAAKDPRIGGFNQPPLY